MRLPPHVAAELEGKGVLPAPIERLERVSGGDIHQAAKLGLRTGDVLFLKFSERPLPRVFEVEAKGLERLRGAGELRVPEVLAVGETFLLLEWIEPDPAPPTARTMRDFGRRLARLHQHLNEQGLYGLDHDNYIGTLPQVNTPTRSWVEFYRARRLGAQLELARSRGRLPPKRRARLERLMERLDEFIDERNVQPSLLHGDLWGGNFLLSGGEAVLIDPAVYYGDREIDLAFTELFGGFPSTFYEGYNEVWPLDPCYEERKALYQLYPLLIHLNLFGESYGPGVDRVLRRYVG